MKKNNKGFFLAETIIMIALVTTVIAFLYPNVSKLYENFANKIKYYDQTQDLYNLRTLYDYIIANSCDNSSIQLPSNISLPGENDIIKIDKIMSGDEDSCSSSNISETIENVGLSRLYISKYMGNPKDNDPDFNRYLHRLKKTTNEPDAYRLIGVFEEEADEGNIIKRYASIKLDGLSVSIYSGGDAE